jgi:hypothetical protein
MQFAGQKGPDGGVAIIARPNVMIVKMDNDQDEIIPIFVTVRSSLFFSIITDPFRRKWQVLAEIAGYYLLT